MVRGWPGEAWSIRAWPGSDSRDRDARFYGRNWSARRGGCGSGEEGHSAGGGGEGDASARRGGGRQDGRRHRTRGQGGSDRARRQGTGAEEGGGGVRVCFGLGFQF